MPDNLGDEGIQPEAAPLRPRGSTREARFEGQGQRFHAEFSITIEDAMAILDRAMIAMKAGAPKASPAAAVGRLRDRGRLRRPILRRS